MIIIGDSHKQGEYIMTEFDTDRFLKNAKKTRRNNILPGWN